MADNAFPTGLELEFWKQKTTAQELPGKGTACFESQKSHGIPVALGVDTFFFPGSPW